MNKGKHVSTKEHQVVSSTRCRSRRRTRWAVVATAAMVLLAVAGCKTSNAASSSGGSTTTAGSGSTEVATDTRAPGVTADAIKVGIAYPDLSSLKDVFDVDNGDYRKTYQAVVDSINAKGGIAGRKIDPVFAPINPIGANASAAACTKLTQDEKVFVAVGYFLNDDVLCYLQTNPTPVIGGTMTQERLSKAKVAWYTTEPGDDVEVDTIRALAEGGKLDGKVAVTGAAADQQSLDRTIKPLLKELDVEVVDTALNDAPLTDANAGTPDRHDRRALQVEGRGPDPRHRLHRRDRSPHRPGQDRLPPGCPLQHDEPAGLLRGGEGQRPRSAGGSRHRWPVQRAEQLPVSRRRHQGVRRRHREGRDEDDPCRRGAEG